MKEIGGYIELEKNIIKEYHHEAIPFNTGRNCLYYLIKQRKIIEIYLPYYICDSVINLCKKAGCKIKFYNIDSNFKPILNGIDNKKYIYVVNYYGLLSNIYIKKIKNMYNNIILDNVQDFFRKAIKNVDTIYSCRKFFGVTDGAYLYTDCFDGKLDYEIDMSSKRISYLFGRFETSAVKYYNMFVENEKKLENEDIKLMSKITHNILRGINYKQVKQIRSKNFKYLNSKLKHTNKLKLRNVKGAYMYPYYVNDGNVLKGKLIDEKIYIPTLWPNILSNLQDNMLEYDMTDNIVFIPVDQRYDIEDMKKIINIIRGV